MSDQKPKFAILGCGNLGQAQAVHLAFHGYDVSLGNRTAATLDPIINNNNTIKVRGLIEGSARLSVVSSDFKQVVEGRDVIVVTVPAVGQAYLIKSILPFLKPTQHIVLHPGQLFGALEVKRLLCQYSSELKTMTVSELESSHLTCRAHAIGDVEIFAMKQHIGFATMPCSRTEEVYRLFCPLYEGTMNLHPNVLHPELNDLNLVAHPIVTMLNAGPIDRGTPFLYYKEGVTPYVGKLLDKADAERVAVAKALGCNVSTLVDWVKAEYGHKGSKGETAYEVITSNSAFDTLKAPIKLYTRYIWEDVPYGLAGIRLLARQVGVKTPVLDTMFDLCCHVFDENFETNARTLHSLELHTLTGEELVHYAETGILPPKLAHMRDLNLKDKQ